VAYRVRASFLAGKGRRSPTGWPNSRCTGRPDPRRGAGKGLRLCDPLAERLALPPGVTAVANAKSSTGRLDLLTRTITDGGTEFDRIPEGYAGPLYAEVCPRSFSVLVRAGQRLNQIRFRRGQAVLTMPPWPRCTPRPAGRRDAVISEGLGFSVDLRPATGRSGRLPRQAACRGDRP
jgi:dCTP deaminase